MWFWDSFAKLWSFDFARLAERGLDFQSHPSQQIVRESAKTAEKKEKEMCFGSNGWYIPPVYCCGINCWPLSFQDQWIMFHKSVMFSSHNCYQGTKWFINTLILSHFECKNFRLDKSIRSPKPQPGPFCDEMPVTLQGKESIVRALDPAKPNHLTESMVIWPTVTQAGGLESCTWNWRPAIGRGKLQHRLVPGWRSRGGAEGGGGHQSRRRSRSPALGTNWPASPKILSFHLFQSAQYNPHILFR